MLARTETDHARAVLGSIRRSFELESATSPRRALFAILALTSQLCNLADCYPKWDRRGTSSFVMTPRLQFS